MSLDDRWMLRETITSILAAKLEAQKRELEGRLEKLGRRFRDTLPAKTAHCRPPDNC